MATLQSINAYIPSAGSAWVTQLGVHSFATTDSSLAYLHLKTNVPASRNTMWMIEFVGYAYGAAQNIRSAICFHTSVNTIYNAGTQNIYPGLTPQAVYKSSDNFAVIRVTSGSFYFTGFVVNAYSTAPYTPNEAFRITAVSQNSNSGTGTY
jgi:hypothetical protein